MWWESIDHMLDLFISLLRGLYTDSRVAGPVLLFYYSNISGLFHLLKILQLLLWTSNNIQNPWAAGQGFDWLFAPFHYTPVTLLLFLYCKHVMLALTQELCFWQQVPLLLFTWVPSFPFSYTNKKHNSLVMSLKYKYHHFFYYTTHFFKILLIRDGS